MKRGQALIAVLLILAVIMTVSLSISSRSTTEVSVSTAQEEAARALAAAEAGVEAKLGGITTGGGQVGNNGSTYAVALTPFGAVSTPLVLPQLLASGETVSVNLTGYGASSIGICWNGTGNLETAFYYGSPTINVTRDYFTPAGNCPGYGGYNFRTVSSLTGSPKLFLELKLLGNTTKSQLVIIPATGANLPTQGDTITSVGQAGESARKVQVNTQDDRPDIFEAAVFSGGSLSK